MLSLIFKLFGDASPLRRTLTGLRTDARAAGRAAGRELEEGMAQSRGGRLRSAVGFGRAASAGVGTILGSGAVSFGKSQIAEGTRLAHLSQELGLTVEQLQKAELAQKLYGNSIFKSTDALLKAMKTLDDMPVMSGKTAHALDAEGQAWTKAWTKIKAGFGQAAAMGSQALRGSLELSPARFLFEKFLVPKGQPLGNVSDKALKNTIAALGGSGSTVAAHPDARPSIKPPTADAMQRIGLFVGGVPLGMQSLKVQQAQLTALNQINNGVRQLNAQLR